MEYKILVTVFVPDIDQKFEFYIPINRYVQQVIDILNQAINNIVFDQFPIKDNLQLCNRRTGEIYNNGLYVRNTNIKNGSQLVLF